MLSYCQQEALPLSCQMAFSCPCDHGLIKLSGHSNQLERSPGRDAIPGGRSSPTMELLSLQGLDANVVLEYAQGLDRRKAETACIVVPTGAMALTPYL